MLSYEDATEQVTGPGQRYELETTAVDGVPVKAFKHAPASLRELFAGARARGDATFLVYEDERWSFAEVMDHVDAMAALLVERYGVTRGDRVAIGMRNYPEWVIAFAAITSIGAVSVSLNAWWTADEMAYALEDSGATVLVADIERVERGLAACERLGCRILAVRAAGDLPDEVDRWEEVRELGAELPEVRVGPDDDATILYTSGTTGEPKEAVSTHRAVLQALMGFGCKTAIDRLRRGEEPSPSSGPPVFILQAHVRERLAAFKVPTVVRVVHEPLPRNAAGKILKRDLRDSLAG